MSLVPRTLQIFETERFSVMSLSPFEARNLLAILLQDYPLASRVSWLLDKSLGGALREAFGVELQTASGHIRVWGIVDRMRCMQTGAIIARNSLEGIDVEVLVASQFWDDGIADEASEPVMEWLSDNTDALELNLR